MYDPEPKTGPSLEEYLSAALKHMVPEIFGDKGIQQRKFPNDVNDATNSGKKKIKVPLVQEVFILFGGFKSSYEIEVSASTIIVTICGIGNTYTIKKAKKFKGQVGLITLIGHSHKFTGADVILTVVGTNEYHDVSKVLWNNSATNTIHMKK